MANIPETSTWDDSVYQIATSDPVLGGDETAILNKAAKALADRTKWLKDRSGIYSQLGGRTVINTNTTIQQASAGVLLILQAVSGNLIITLDSLTNLTENSVFHFKTFVAPGKSITIQTNDSSPITLGGIDKSKLYFHDREWVKIMVRSDGFEVESCSNDIFEVGADADGQVVRSNTIVRNGQIINRADYPRIAEWVLDYTNNGLHVVDETTWNSYQDLPNGDRVYPYKGFWGFGDGSTTIRVPDDRAMYPRYADLGLSLDVNRISNEVGSYESDGIRTHEIDIPVGKTSKTQDGYGKVTTGADANEPIGIQGAGHYNGISETNVKNHSKLPLTKI